MQFKNGLELIYISAFFQSLDLHFATFICKSEQTDSFALYLAAAMASYSSRSGHICFEIGKSELPDIPFIPESKAWIKELSNFNCIGSPKDSESKMMIIDNKGRLYLNRYFNYEKELISFIRSREDSKIKRTYSEVNIDKLFPSLNSKEDKQKTAALKALSQTFLIISGGPGTGKTSTLAKIISLIISNESRSRIALAAPTGKAAARLEESLSNIFKDYSDNHINVQTVHRLLRPISGTPYFQFNKENHLPFDFVIIDEASMLDIALCAKLISAISEKTVLILTGDKDQLSSVESGAVLGDLCGVLKENNLVELNKNYRFENSKGISTLSQSIRSGEAIKCLEILEDSIFSDVEFILNSSSLKKQIEKSFKTGFKDFRDSLKKQDISEIFNAFNKFRIITALRKGPSGADNINAFCSKLLKANSRNESLWFVGRPIMITENSYTQELYNGDIGIALNLQNQIKVYFPANNGLFREISPSQLPKHETAFAVTCHKSQGSEYDNILFILPEKDNPLLTREMLYTGITRARKTVSILGQKPILMNSIARKVERSSGIIDALKDS